MPRLALLVSAAALLATAVPLAVASNASAAPLAPAVTCGTHFGTRDSQGYYPEYWGNCGTTNTIVSYHGQSIVLGGGVVNFPGHTVCAPAGQDVLIGSATSLSGEGFRYVVTGTSGTC